MGSDDEETSGIEDYTDYTHGSGTCLGSGLLIAANEMVFQYGKLSTWEFGSTVLQAEEPKLAEKLKDALLSNTYNTIIIDDEVIISGPLRRTVGKELRRFFDHGGTVVIYAWMGFSNLTDVLRKLFGTSWTGASYYRTTFSRTAAATALFPGVDVNTFSAKCNMIEVPASESMWASTVSSKAQSLSMVLSGQSAEPNLTAVAVHKGRGGGQLVYFGDVNWEVETCKLLKFICQPKDSNQPSNVKSQTTESSSTSSRPSVSLSSAEEFKAQGNEHFKQGSWKAAAGSYMDGISVLLRDARLESDSVKPLVVALYANLSLCYLKQELFKEAAEAAGSSLLSDPAHTKARYRRALALEKLGDVETAEIDLRKLLEAEPQNKDAMLQLERLKSKSPVKTPSQSQERPNGVPVPPQTGGTTQANNSASWASGLDQTKRYEWLVDCYRMRVDDDYVWGGGNLHGLYNPSASAFSIMKDFLVFCKLAVQRCVVPASWDWITFLKQASLQLPYAFEKSDAQEKWGSENVFSAMMGGRSLRFTAEIIYGTGVQAVCETDPLEEKINKIIRQTAPKEAKLENFRNSSDLFQDVGGPDAWFELLSSLPQAAQGNFEDSDEDWSDSMSDVADD